MADGRRPGPTGGDAVATLVPDAGTLPLWPGPLPGPLPADARVDGWGLPARFAAVLGRVDGWLTGGPRRQFLALRTPAETEALAATLAAWADTGAATLDGQPSPELVAALHATASARLGSDLDDAARWLAGAIERVGVVAFAAVAFQGPGRRAADGGGAPGPEAPRFGGMTPAHFRAFQEVAAELGRVIAVRDTNPASTPWIARGFPPKPMAIKIKTSPRTGFVTARDPGEVRAAREAGFLVVDPDGAPRGLDGQAPDPFPRPDWPVEAGQVVHPDQLRPLVGDYDLLGVIDPTATGRNLVLAASEGRTLDDWSNPDVRRVATALNARLDQPRVMHGAHDGAFALPSKGGAVVFLPEGTTLELATPEDVAAFYRALGRRPVVKP